MTVQARKKSAAAAPSPAQARLQRRVLAVADAVGDFIAYWGFKAIHGKVWAILALSRRPLTQVEISRILGVSRSLISGSVAELTTLGLVRPVRPDRNAPYQAVIDVWPTISDVLRSREWMLIEAARVALEGAVDEAAAAEREGAGPADWSVERLRFLLKMTQVAQTFIKLLLRMRVAPAVDTFGSWLSKAATLVTRLG